MTHSTHTIRHLFVYGTLQPGESRWHELEAFVRGEGVRTTVAGRVYDTGLDYPAAKFSPGAATDVICGRVYEFDDALIDVALARLDEVEGAERGMYERVVVQTAAGPTAWAYECNDDELLVRLLPDGDWLQRAKVGPTMRIAGPVLDAADPVALAHFYERLLGWEIVALEGPRPGYPPEDGWAKLRSPAADQKIEIQWEQHYRAPTWPPVAGEQQMMMHLDIGVANLDEGVAWAVELGATVAEHQPQQDVRVMLDPAGHPFCLFPDATLTETAATETAATKTD